MLRTYYNMYDRLYHVQFSGQGRQGAQKQPNAPHHLPAWVLVGEIGKAMYRIPTSKIAPVTLVRCMGLFGGIFSCEFLNSYSCQREGQVYVDFTRHV